jgi:hypothetical protein
LLLLCGPLYQTIPLNRHQYSIPTESSVWKKRRLRRIVWGGCEFLKTEEEKKEKRKGREKKTHTCVKR